MGIPLSLTIWQTIKLSAAETHLLACLATFGEADGSRIFPSVGTMAHYTNYSRTQVKRILVSLCRKGVLRLVRKESGWKTREYRIDLEKAPKKPHRYGARGLGHRMVPQEDMLRPSPGPSCQRTPLQDDPN